MEQRTVLHSGEVELQDKVGLDAESRGVRSISFIKTYIAVFLSTFRKCSFEKALTHLLLLRSV
jgi:hypothetical protein